MGLTRILYGLIRPLLLLACFSFAMEGWAEPRFFLVPSFSISEVYDDNLFPGGSSKSWDFYTSIRPGLEANFILKFAELELGYKPTFNLFPRHFDDPGIREIQHDAYFESKTQFSFGLSLVVRDQYYSIPFSYSRAPFTPSNWEQTNEASISAAYALELSPTIDMNLSSDFARFDATSPGNDGYRFGGNIVFKKQFTSSFSISLENIGSKYYYDDLQSDPVIYSFLLRPQYQITGRIKGVAGFGYNMLKIGGIGTEHNYRYDLRFEYETDLEKFLAIYFAQNYDTDLIGNAFNRRAVGLDLAKRLLENLGASMGLSFSDYYDAYGNDTMMLEFNTALSFDLGRDFFFEVGYNGYFSEWGRASENIMNNRFFMTLRYEKGISSED